MNVVELMNKIRNKEGITEEEDDFLTSAITLYVVIKAQKKVLPDSTIKVL